MPEPIARRCRRIAESQRFQAFIFGVIVFNAVVLGLDTYDELSDDYGELLTVLNDACLGVFVVEVAIRISSSASVPGRSSTITVRSVGIPSHSMPLKSRCQSEHAG